MSRSVKKSITVPNPVREGLNLQIDSGILDYPSEIAAWIGLARYQLLIGKPHPVTAAIAHYRRFSVGDFIPSPEPARAAAFPPDPPGHQRMQPTQRTGGRATGAAGTFENGPGMAQTPGASHGPTGSQRGRSSLSGSPVAGRMCLATGRVFPCRTKPPLAQVAPSHLSKKLRLPGGSLTGMQSTGTMTPSSVAKTFAGRMSNTTASSLTNAYESS